MRRIVLASIGAALGAMALAAPAWSQPTQPQAAAPAAPALKPIAPVHGVVTAFDGKSLTVKAVDGASKTFTVDPGARIVKLTKIDASAIRPGSFVATANVTQPDGSGVSTEFRVFTEELRGLGEGHGPMNGEPAGTMMTNGTVSAQVTSTPRGREMDVTYNGTGGHGVRHIVIPATVTIREMSLADRAQIKPGIAVDVRAGATADGSLVARAVLIGENGQPPAS
jgi:hypothetical protein